MAIQTPNTDTRKAYQAKVRAELDKINAQIDEYKAKADQAKAETAATYHSHVEELLTKRDAVQAKFQEIQSASEAAWQDLQKGLDSAWDDLAQSFQKAVKQFE
jgi:uncharacterized coiled-coil DUF342 family protein